MKDKLEQALRHQFYAGIYQGQQNPDYSEDGLRARFQDDREDVEDLLEEIQLQAQLHIVSHIVAQGDTNHWANIEFYIPDLRDEIWARLREFQKSLEGKKL